MRRYSRRGITTSCSRAEEAKGTAPTRSSAGDRRHPRDCRSYGLVASLHQRTWPLENWRRGT